MTNETLSEAIRLIRAGQKAEAQLVLEPYIMDHPQDIQAWMWEAEIFPNDADKIKVLEICLGHNPGHPQVNQALGILRQRSGIFPEPEPAPEPLPPPRVIADIPDPAPLYTDEPEPTPVSPPVQQPPETKQAKHEIVRKHPDWPMADGVVEFAEIRMINVNRVPMYYADIGAMYVAGKHDYSIRFKYAKKTSLSPFDAEILTSTFAPGTGIKVSYHPRNPSRAWVDEWDPKVVRRRLKEFKDRPDIRATISRRYKARMMNGFWLTLGGGAATVIGSLIFSELGGVYVVFYGAIAIGIIYFLSGLIGWLWNMD